MRRSGLVGLAVGVRGVRWFTNLLIQMVLWLTPSLVKNSQVDGQVEQRPLGPHVIGPPDCPASKSVVLFEVSKMPLDNPPAFGKSLLSLNRL